MKKCTRCLKVKPLSEFGYRNRKTKEGVKPSILSYCKQCNAEYSRKRYMEMRTNNLKCVYRFLNFNEEVIYVGKTERIEYRINLHMSKSGHLPAKCYEEVYKKAGSFYGLPYRGSGSYSLRRRKRGDSDWRAQ